MAIRASWLRKRNLVRDNVARAFSAKCGISLYSFLREFYDAEIPPPIVDFEGQYIPDSDTLDEILNDIARKAGLPKAAVDACFFRKESFPQFAERLLRSGAYRDMG